jgi:hypothetical protein
MVIKYFEKKIYYCTIYFEEEGSKILLINFLKKSILNALFFFFHFHSSTKTPAKLPRAVQAFIIYQKKDYANI